MSGTPRLLAAQERIEARHWLQQHRGREVH
jgi:hypothetical protein